MVEIYVAGKEAGVDLTPDEEAELEDRMAGVDRGEWIDGDEFLRQLNARSRS